MAQVRKDKDERSQKEISEMHNSYMKRLHEWQKICNFHYTMCWQMHNAQMLSFRHAQASANLHPTTAQQTPSNNQRRTVQNSLRTRVEYRPALISNRFAAEVLDFLLLLLIKLIVILLYSNITDTAIQNMSFHLIFTDDFLDEDISVDDLRYMMLIGLLYRILTCFYEAVFVAACGATPGKFMVGIEVVSCRSCIAVDRGGRKILIVQPGNTPSLGSSWIRSMIKNFSITFLMPAFLTIFFYQHNRTSYDIVANTIVVRSNSV